MDRIPLLLITGFLGSGKTTFVESLLRNPAFHRSALLVNEIGTTGIDQDVLRQSLSSEPIVLPGGCICCSMGRDLGYALRELELRRERGQVAPFDRVVIETTGLADPVPVIEQLATDPWLRARYSLTRTITLCDGVAGEATLREHAESVSQVVQADLLLVSKEDLSAQVGPSLRRTLGRMNPLAQVYRVVHGAVDGLSLSQLLAPSPRAAAPLKSQPGLKTLRSSGGICHAVSSATIQLQALLPWRRWANALDRVVSQYSVDCLRVKGILHVTDAQHPILVQGVRTTFSAPVPLPALNESRGASRVVLIAKGGVAISMRQALIGHLGTSASLREASGAISVA